MSVPALHAAGVGASSPLEAARRAVAILFGPPTERAFAVRYWDDSVEDGAVQQTPFTLVLRTPWGLRAMCLPPSELAIAEAFVRGDVDVEGDLEGAVRLVDETRHRVRGAAALARLTLALLALPRRPASRPAPLQLADRHGRLHSLSRDATAVRSHYDVGNDFYQLWLDRSMTYSCAYFPTGSEDIDAAQAAKLDYICRKLRLAPGERLLDIGCGWGALIRHAARNYGVDATGITLSEPQAALARQRIAEEGLDGRCRVEVRDYRAMPERALFDKVVSVGMFEHVGRSRAAEYFAAAYRVTRPGGVFLNHAIIRLRERGSAVAQWLGQRFWRQGEFIDRYVFPDGELVPLDVELRAAERAGFEPRDVETLREHYALTLREWVRRLERARGTIESTVGERIYRIWRLYMAASAHAFTVGRITIAQVLLARPDATGRAALPRTRADLYTVHQPASRIAVA